MNKLTTQERAAIYATVRPVDIYLLGMKDALDKPARARELLTGGVGTTSELFGRATVRFLTYTTPPAYRAPTRSLEQRLERVAKPRALGDATVPAQAYPIFAAIMAQEENDDD